MSIASLFVGLLVAAAPAPAFAESSCVECHKTANAPYLGHDFADWSGSKHAEAGISCDACHGGDAAAKGKTEAHRGLRPSTDASSPLYFTKIPATCGACHPGELSAFEKSRHGRELARTGKGPNCATCHGSMANHVLTPRELEMTCTLCHRRPTQAYATMLSLDHAGKALDRLAAALSKARADRVDTAAQEKSFQEARTLHDKALVDWHTFKMPEVLAAAQDVSRRVVNALNELRLKGKVDDKPKR